MLSREPIRLRKSDFPAAILPGDCSGNRRRDGSRGRERSGLVIGAIGARPSGEDGTDAAREVSQ